MGGYERQWLDVVYSNWLGAVYSNSITLTLRKLSQNFEHATNGEEDILGSGAIFSLLELSEHSLGTYVRKYIISFTVEFGIEN